MTVDELYVPDATEALIGRIGPDLFSRCPFPSDPFKIILGYPGEVMTTPEYPGGVPPMLVYAFGPHEQRPSTMFACFFEGDRHGIDVTRSEEDGLLYTVSNQVRERPGGGHAFLVDMDDHKITPQHKKELLFKALYSALYAFENAEVIEVEPRISHTKERIKVPGKKARTQTVKLVTRRYLLPPRSISGARKYGLERWGVRGHWRTYRTGKRVWINPYEKGKGAKRKDTTYIA
jgi:hypothetical protein